MKILNNLIWIDYTFDSINDALFVALNVRIAGL